MSTCFPCMDGQHDRCRRHADHDCVCYYAHPTEGKRVILLAVDMDDAQAWRPGHPVSLTVTLRNLKARDGKCGGIVAAAIDSTPAIRLHPRFEDMNAEVLPCLAANQPVMKLPIEWATEHGYLIADPDGWRGENAKPFTDPIDLEEFHRRSTSCTIGPLSTLSAQVMLRGALKRSDLAPERVAELLDVARTFRLGVDAELAAAEHAAATAIARAADVPLSIVGIEPP